MAIWECEADHETDDAEKTFLRDLAAALGLAAPAAAALVATADAVAAAEPGAIEPFLLPSIPPPLPLAAAAPGAVLKPEVDSLALLTCTATLWPGSKRSNPPLPAIGL